MLLYLPYVGWRRPMLERELLPGSDEADFRF
jgi:hypothetical protein